MRPDFQQMKTAIAGLQNLDGLLCGMFGQTEQLKEAAVRLCADMRKKQAVYRLEEIPVEELKNSKAGIRITLLTDGGYQTLRDLYEAEDEALCALRGMGEKQVGAIRMIIDQFLVRFSDRERIRLSDERGDADNANLICALARYRLSETVCRDAADLVDTIHAFLNDTVPRIRIRSTLRWFFSRSAVKEETLAAYHALTGFERSSDYQRAQRFAALYLDAVSIGEAQAFSDFENNSASYYALLERLSQGQAVVEEALYGSVPAALAAQVDSQELDLERFRGDLRSYQQFGARYILCQKQVLLGDEMGLGKTIQAIAAMVHLYTKEPGCFFLIVCPASVMVNWCREIRKFSEIPVHLLHGLQIKDAFEVWQKEAGAAVVNYESLRHITDGINDRMKLALMVVDEAHYIKNPEALRTRYIHSLKEEAERILLMTGTPLENKVEEMCELVGFVRPDMVSQIKAYAGMHQVAEFREMLSPVYLRRQADQVLAELPECIENEEWCTMTAADLIFYRREVQAGNFMGMRRVCFLQDDLMNSSKGERLAQLCGVSLESGLKVVVYSFFRETLRKVRAVIGDYCIGEINGNTPALERQGVIDAFAASSTKNVLLCQVQSGGTGLNIQAASVVIFCEPQIKPSLERQAIARVHRMGQIRNVLVYHLLCEFTVDEVVRSLLAQKTETFETYAQESAMADAEAGMEDQDWIRSVVEQEQQRYLPAVVTEPE